MPREAVRKVSNAPFCTAVDISTLGWESLNMRVHFDICPLLLGMSVASLSSPPGSHPAWQSPLEIFGPSSDQPFWLNIPLTYYWLIVNFHLNYCSLLSTSPSSEQRNSRTVKRKHDYFKLAIRQLSIHLYMNIVIDRNTLWHEKKLSFIYTINCYRRTDLDRSLISYRNLLRCSIKTWELCERCDISRSDWKLWHIVPWWVPLHFIHYLY